MATKKEYNLTEAIEALACSIDKDVDIVQVRIVGPAKNPIVRVYVDYPGGVTFDILAQTQGWIGRLLDELDPFPCAYTLEVSSPGIDRPLRKVQHFIDAIGKNAHIKTDEKIEDRAAFTGKILSADKEEIKLELDEGKKGEQPIVIIPFEAITAANLKGDL